MNLKSHLAFALTTLGLFAGCASSGQTDALAGAGIGALAGQVLGGNSKATLLGAGVGAGIGYVIGNEHDKTKAAEMNAEAERQRRLRSESTVSSGGQAAPASYSHQETGDLAGTRWNLISLAPRSYASSYSSKIVEFKQGGTVEVTTTRPSGAVEVDHERYRVVGSTLIVNGDNHLINATYDIDGNQMIVTSEEFRAVLSRI